MSDTLDDDAQLSTSCECLGEITHMKYIIPDSLCEHIVLQRRSDVQTVSKHHSHKVSPLQQTCCLSHTLRTHCPPSQSNQQEIREYCGRPIDRSHYKNRYIKSTTIVL